MRKKPTIYDVSKLAGVSTATISRVLNDPAKVNAETRKIVENAIQELGYRPLLEARLRNLKDTSKICVLAPRFTESSFVQRLRGITVALAGRNYELQVVSVASRDQMERFIETIELRGLDGLITLSLPFSDRQIEKVISVGTELTMIEYTSPLVNCILIDDFHGGKIAGDYLVSLGRKKYGIAAELTRFDYSVFPNTARMNGYRAALADHGALLRGEYVYDLSCRTDVVYQRFLEVFRSGNFPDAIFATADVQAMGILRAAHETGVRVPDDIAIIGFDDIDFADYVGLTTIRQNLDQSGMIAVDLLTNRLKNPDRLVQKVQLPVELVVRKTA